MIKKFLILIGLTATLMTGCARSYMEQGRLPLNGAAIVTQLPGHTLIGGIKNQAGPWATYVQRNGLALFRTPTGEILETQWAVAGDRFCYSEVGGVEKICMSVYRKGDGYQFLDDTGRETVYATKKSVGDALNLSGFLDSQRVLNERRARQMQLEARRTARTQPMPLPQ